MGSHRRGHAPPRSGYGTCRDPHKHPNPIRIYRDTLSPTDTSKPIGTRTPLSPIATPGPIGTHSNAGTPHRHTGIYGDLQLHQDAHMGPRELIGAEQPPPAPIYSQNTYRNGLGVGDCTHHTYRVLQQHCDPQTHPNPMGTHSPIDIWAPVGPYGATGIPQRCANTYRCVYTCVYMCAHACICSHTRVYIQTHT